MYRRCLAPSVQGPQRLLVSPVLAGRSSGGPATHSERPRGGWRDRPSSGRGSHSRDDPRDERRDERRGGWRDERRDERRGGWRDEGRDERRDQRQYSRGRNDNSDGGSRDSRGQEGGGSVEYDTGKRYGSGDGRPQDRDRGRGENGGFGGSRQERERAPEPDDRRRSFAGSSSRGPQQQERRQQQQQQPRASRGREEQGNMDDQADDEYDGEYDEVDDEEAGPAGRRAGAGGGPCLRDTLEGEALYGVFPVLAALRAKRRKVHRAFMLASLDLSKRKDAGLIRQVEALCTEAGVDVVRTSRHELNLMSHDRPHQGLVLDVSSLEWASLDEFPSADQVMQAAAAAAARGAAAGPPPPPVWLALDEVVDPQNLGAVVRSAYCLGAAGVLACARNCAPLSSVVSKASAGALEALQLHSCHNMPRTLLDARDNKGWAVLGAAAGSGSEPVERVRVDRPTILVLGSEGFGLRTNVRRACSGLVRVDMAPVVRTGGAAATTAGSSGDAGDGAAATETAAAAAARRQQQQVVLRGLVDSLNVSVATGILLHSLIHSAGTPAPLATAAAATGPEVADGSSV
ncbi:hypothetical protein PLESTF_001777600 [Pleodorina starrii]|nr:hypothetical protein PLESTF_001777600 [Pleodorina starrii]